MSSNSVCNHTRDKKKSDSRCAVVRFWYHLYDYRPNWIPLSRVTIAYRAIDNWAFLTIILSNVLTILRFFILYDNEKSKTLKQGKKIWLFYRKNDRFENNLVVSRPLFSLFLFLTNDPSLSNALHVLTKLKNCLRG